MPTAAESALDVTNTRRWPRYQANLPVLISAGGDPIPGLANEISRSGMALYGGVCLEPGDLMKVEFQTSTKLSVAGVVRNRSGFCFGLEFLTLLAIDEDAANPAEFALPLPQERLRDWLARHRGDVSLAMASAFLLFSLFAWDARPSSLGKQPSLSVWERALVKLGLAELPEEPALAGNPAVQVWIDQHTALYYCPGSELYGKTPDGRFTTQRDAQMDQFEPAARAYCQ
ncbi:MAG TPA: PilZ domain-containing protein [Terriglobales bacterium]|nr:PilZ domain-containing protein [Terriglobales bacterium]